MSGVDVYTGKVIQQLQELYQTLDKRVSTIEDCFDEKLFYFKRKKEKTEKYTKERLVMDGDGKVSLVPTYLEKYEARKKSASEKE